VTVAGKNQTSWTKLFRIACGLIRQVNADSQIIDHWTFGGGTAMMLQIDHRESHDVDIFLDDPQVLPYLNPQRHHFSIAPDYSGDGARFLKLSFEDIGEIDFIVDSLKTSNPTLIREVEGERTLLETIPEIITKKIVHRGESIKPRDIFDIAAAGEAHREPVIAALRPYRPAVVKTLSRLEALNPEFINSVIVSELIIRDQFKPLARIALHRAKQLLQAV
jgi:hypothetical protein